MSDIRQNKPVKSRKLIQLPPILKKELMCVGGTLRHEDMPVEAKHQNILAGNSRVLLLILRFVREKNYQYSSEQLVALSREKHCIVNRKNFSLLVT